MIWPLRLLSKKDGKDQETIQSSTTPNTPHGKVTKNTINITNKSQEISPFPAGDHKAAMSRIESMRNTRQKKTNDPQKIRLGTVSKNILLEGLNPISPLVQMWIKIKRFFMLNSIKRFFMLNSTEHKIHYAYNLLLAF